MLFGKLPEYFKNDTELREIWSMPDTRKKLLEGLSQSGIGDEQPAEMQRIIDAERSYLFDVLAYVAQPIIGLNCDLTTAQRICTSQVAGGEERARSQRSVVI